MSIADLGAVRFADMRRGHDTYGAFTAAAYRFHGPLRWRAVDYLEIMAIVDGVGRKTETLGSGQGGSVTLHTGDVVLVRAGTQNLLEVGDAGGLSVVIVSFPASDWQTLAGFIGVDPRWRTVPLPPKVNVGPEQREALRAFDTVLERSQHGLSRLDLLRFLVVVVPLLLPLSDRGAIAGELPAWLSASVDAMNDEDNLRGGVPRLQTLAHVSAQYLSTMVRRHYDMTPSALVADLRLRHAALLLVTTAASVAEIAERCGYRSPEYFATCFKRAHQVSPRRYRSRFTKL